VVILELRDVHEALTRQVQNVQREFTTVQDKLAVLRREWTEADPADRPAIMLEQDKYKEQQHALADGVNLWRDRLRAIEIPKGEEGLKQTLAELEQCGIPDIAEAVGQARALMVMDPDERAALFQQQQMAVAANTPAGRLLERARTSYDLRHDGAAAMQKAAVEFANRTGIAQDDGALAELEAAFKHKDAFVAEVAVRAALQMLRFRIMRSAEASVIHQAAQKLTAINHPLVVPTLIELVTTPRIAYRETPTGSEEESNSNDRLLALIALVERWRTRDVQNIVRTRAHDMDPQLANAAQRALDAFPGEWA
jgi:hypothetical protein